MVRRRSTGLHRASLLGFLTLAIGVGCGGSEELVVYLDSDLSAVQTDRARLEVSRDGDTQYERDIDEDVARGFVLRLKNDGDSGSEINLLLQGIKDDTIVIERKAEVSFASGNKMVPLHLCQSCLGKLDCASGQSCVRGSCVDADIDANDLADASDQEAYRLTCSGAGGAGGSGGAGPETCDSICETSDACGTCPIRAITGSVSLNFNIARHEVTRDEYDAFLAVNPVPHDRLPARCAATVDFTPDANANAQACSGDCGNHPVVGITGCQASAYCFWTGGYLCFDTQWQAACEGPNTSPQTLYPYGDAYEAGRCNDGGQNPGTVPVDSGANCQGSLDNLFNMSGNAAEVTRIAPDGDFEVRGGHYQSGAADLSCLATAPEPDAPSAQVGFRCCYD